jgi:hypothetical protein
MMFRRELRFPLCRTRDEELSAGEFVISFGSELVMCLRLGGRRTKCSRKGFEPTDASTLNQPAVDPRGTRSMGREI